MDEAQRLSPNEPLFVVNELNNAKLQMRSFKRAMNRFVSTYGNC